MSKHVGTRTGLTKRRNTPANSHLTRATKLKSDSIARQHRDRAERQRLLDARRSEEAAALVALARTERAKRIAAGKVVAPTIEEWREGRRTAFTTMGDLA